MTPPRVSQEGQWLLDSARAFVRSDAAGEKPPEARWNGRRDESSTDWEQLVRLAETHGMTALLHRHIEASHRHLVPAETRAALRARYIERVGRTLQRSSQLLDLLDALSGRGIRAVPSKGPAMSAALYGNVALRDYRDLDLCINQDDLPRARDLLIELGYTVNPGLGEETMRHDGVLSFRSDEGGRVEIRWAPLLRGLDAPLENGGWERLGTTKLCGRDVPSFSPEDQLIVLCADGAEHCWDRLVWVCDVARLLEVHADLDWESVFHRAHVMRSRRILLLGLRLAHDCLGAPLPEPVLRRVSSDPTHSSLAQLVLEGMFGPPEAAWTAARKNRFHQTCRDRFMDRVRNATLRLTRPSANGRTPPLPAALQFLHYPARVIRQVSSRLRRTVRA